MKVTEWIKDEPVMAAAIAPIVTAALGLLVAFGVDLSPDQQNAIKTMALVTVPILIVIGNRIARGQVTPVADPRNNEGEQLVTVAEAEASLGPVGGVR